MSHRVILAALVVFALQCGYYYTRLPATMASHFGGNGMPNGWSDKLEYFGLMAGVVALLAGVFLLLPELLSRLSPYSMNLPNRDFWLAPERREETIQYMREAVRSMMAATLALMVIVNQLVIDANLREEPRLSSATVWLLGGYLGFAGVWAVRIYRRFGRVPHVR
jgi:uncharacterized membrane protein